MKKYEVIKSANDFNEIINSRKYQKNGEFVIYIRKNECTNSRFGLAVGKKMGNAVERNKFKRQLRKIITEHKKEFPKGLDYIIIMKGKCKEISYSEMEASFCDLISKKESK